MGTTTQCTLLAMQAEAFAGMDIARRGTWKLVAEAMIARDLYRAGFLVCTMGDDPNARIFDSWVRDRNKLIVAEIRG